MKALLNQFIDRSNPVYLVLPRLQVKSIHALVTSYEIDAIDEVIKLIKQSHLSQKILRSSLS